MVSYMEKDSLYCRVHALKALCAFGDPESVVDALLLMERKQGAELHEKVIVEILLIFQGEADLLIECLWKDIKQFSVRIQRALLDYIRFQSGKYGDEMLAIMENEALDKELRFAAIRYFGKYPDPRAKDTLLSFTRDLDSLKWEFTAISASSLARYEGTDVIEALIAAMHSANWYVRYNAAASLEAQGLSYGQLLEVLQGDDRYARDYAGISVRGAENDAGEEKFRLTMRDFIQFFLWTVEGLFVLYMIGYASFLFISVTVGSSDLYAAKRRNLLKNELSDEYYVPVSIIVPAHNEAVTIEATIRSLLALEYKLYEIIVVDDGSTDDTSKIVQEAFHMWKIHRPIQRRISCQPVQAIYETREWKGADYIGAEKEWR